jgi:hypothetical protein
MGRIAGRTESGNPTAEARAQHGVGSTGKFPVFDQKSALSALKLRGHSDAVSSGTVINKVSRWASANDNATVKAAVERARNNG